jgi:hypothetical protein
VPTPPTGPAAADAVTTNPDLYSVVFENDRVRVVEYLDAPGDATAPHSHPDSVMVTLSSFRRRLTSGDSETEVELPAHKALWLDAQEHSGTNIGTTATHTVFVELKEPSPSPRAAGRLGPQGG